MDDHAPLPDPQPAPLPDPVRVPLARRPLGILGSLQAGRRNVLELVPEIATRAPILSGTTGKRWHMVMEPGALRHILRDRVEDYPKSVVTKLILEPAIGNSLFNAEGRDWLWQRRTAAPVFSHRNIAALGPVMTAAAEESAGTTRPSKVEKSSGLVMSTTVFPASWSP